MSDDQTLPPNNPQGWLIRAGRWIVAHPDIAIPVACFVVGAILGAVVF